jgi:hypothetical protein
MAFMVWLSVRIQMMNQNAYPAVREDVLAALPTRATRDPNERQPHHLFQLCSRWPVRAVSHKV